MPNFITFKDGSNVTRKLQVTPYNTTDDVIQTVVTISNQSSSSQTVTFNSVPQPVNFNNVAQPITFNSVAQPVSVSQPMFVPDYQNQNGNTRVVRSVPAKLGAIKVENLITTVRYFMLFNSATAPASGSNTNLVDVFSVSDSQVLILGQDFFGMNGLPFTTGLVWAWSTTAGVYTAPAATNESRISVYSSLS